MHHALVDGVAAVDIGTVLLDPSPEPLDLPPAGDWEPRRYDRMQHLARLSLSPLDRARRLPWEDRLRALADPRRAAEELRRATDDLRSATEVALELARTRPQAPPTPLNDGIGPNRRYATARLDLDALKAVAKPRGATVNDAVLAIVTGMLRRYLVAAGTPLRAAARRARPGQRAPGGRRGRQPHLHGARRAPGRRGGPRRHGSRRCTGAPAHSRTPRRCARARCSWERRAGRRR